MPLNNCKLGINSQIHLRNHLSAILSALFGFFVSIYFFYPGFMTNDSVIALDEARTGQFTDLQPPLMAWVWGKFDQIVPGPIGMLVFHNALFWTALALLAISIFDKPRARALFVLSFGFFPPIFSLLGMIWKDVGMGSALLLGSSLVLLAQKKASRILLALSIPSFVYAFTIRHNAILIAPLFCLWISLNITKKIRSALFVTVFLFCFFIAFLKISTAVLIQDRRQYTEQAIYIQDLAGISIDQGSLQFPDSFKQISTNLTLDWVKKGYFPPDNANQLCYTGHPWITSQPIIDALAGEWKKQILKHPVSYLKHRLRVFWYFLGFRTKKYLTYHYIGQRDPVSGDPKYSKLHQKIFHFGTRILDRVNQTPVFSSGTYMILLLVLCFRRYRRMGFQYLFSLQPEQSAPWIIGCSGIVYFLSYFLIVSGADFRYSWWMVVATMLFFTFEVRSRRDLQ